MDLDNRTVLILGGSGLVGGAVARRLLDYRPSRIVLVALYEEEVRQAAEALAPWRGETEISVEWGNVFLPALVAKRPRAEMLNDPALRRRVIDDVLGAFTDEILERSFLYHLFRTYEPEAVVDCINTATAFAYQDVFSSARSLLDAAHGPGVSADDVERHILTLTMPQLIRHVQIALECMKRARTRAYVKIGTSGTGGMGLNIPYTHSEERPSRTLLTKSAVAGAQSLMLFLMGRTPDGPAAIEIKPTAAIAWREIAYGPVRRGGRSLQKYDCPTPVSVDRAFGEEPGPWKDLGRPLESVYIDVGENGVFARDEFETVTSLGQMEFITPEEVADYVVMELRGAATGRNVVSALDSATAGPTYRAGVLRATALERLDALRASHGIPSVAFEMLGPPRLTKMLYEGHILSRLCPSVRALAASDAAAMAGDSARLVAEDGELRAVILSVGLPIMLEGGNVYRGKEVLLPPEGTDLDLVVRRGWVDLRASRFALWIRRARRMVEQDEARRAHAGESGSRVDWHAIGADDPITPAQFAKWVFRYEDGGERIKR